MKRTARNQEEWARRFEAARGSQKTSASDAVAMFKVNYPRLMKKVPVKVVAQGSRTSGGMKVTRHGQMLVDGPMSPAFLKAKTNPRIEIAPSNSLKRAVFTLGHEMQHATEYRKLTGKQAVRRFKLNKTLVPYGIRPEEWRADFAGIKRVAKNIDIGANELKAFKREIYGSRAVLGARSASVRAAPIVAAAILYKRHLDKKARSA